MQAVQERLAALGYWLGRADGTYGHLTQQAVLALRGAAGPDRDAGLVVIADDGRPTTVLHTSTGTFERCTYDGQRYLADTPAGTFGVHRAVEGWHGGPLGDGTTTSCRSALRWWCADPRCAGVAACATSRTPRAPSGGR